MATVQVASNPVDPISGTPETTRFQIERDYRQTSSFQWVRELLQNAIEADAKKVVFGLHFPSVESTGTYRRAVADDGTGMSPDEVIGFFKTYGASGKPVGGMHDNMGIGAKTSLLPWNKEGLVVITMKDGVESMIHIRFEPKREIYGLRTFGEDNLSVVDPDFEDGEYGFMNWSHSFPDWVREARHGTVVVLLGNDAKEHTMQGNPERDEEAVRGVSMFLNRRFFELEPLVVVEEFRGEKSENWPTDRDDRHPQRRINPRTIEGAAYFLRYEKSSKGRLVANDSVPLSDGTKVHWYLWEGDRPDVHGYAWETGYVAVSYQKELFDASAHSARFRQFGIVSADLRQKVTLIIEPTLAGPGGQTGVYPRPDRSGLLVQGGRNAGLSLPLDDWGYEFGLKLPPKIRSAAKLEQIELDGEWKRKLRERFGARWRMIKRRVISTGTTTVDPDQEGTKRMPRPPGQPRPQNGNGRSGGVGGTTGKKSTGTRSGDAVAEEISVGSGIPDYRLVHEDDMGEDAKWIAVWDRKSANYPSGCVLLNVDHVVIREIVSNWQDKYPNHEEDAERFVVSILGELLVAKVAHSEWMTGAGLTHTEVEEQLRAPSALTMALLGLIAEDHFIATHIGGKLGRKAA